MATKPSLSVLHVCKADSKDSSDFGSCRKYLARMNEQFVGVTLVQHDDSTLLIGYIP